MLSRLLEGHNRNVDFADFTRLVEAFGFRLDRTRGSHHFYVHVNAPEVMNLQSVQGEAKPYQIRQFLKLVERYNLALEDRE